ncbi:MULTISPECIES: hypothetical protein [unclassified Paraburkholderia]|uniref:hypothetical protein n=1 Tax=unclassified Paraburkholderia TaxID=2615204 RepID=UPI0016225A3C|nr:MULTISPECIES: hypothetical protein [unclassified Paraburkholderia]MBB5445002.1 hypothetical protein [Paraburkholderia sp. WSM4177]MBB5483933.1 hypothetical protein [Paraburkholderia sp. WSM4180]
MRLIAFAAASLCLGSAAWAGQPAASAPATAAGTAAAATTASADKVYPPLPTLSMLPPSTGDDDDLPAPRSTSHNKKKTHQHDCRCAMPTPRLVVSDESRTYLKDIERQLDSALAQ